MCVHPSILMTHVPCYRRPAQNPTYANFSKAEDPVADVIAQAEAILGCPLPGATAHIVRDVSPHKLMMCVSFLLPDAVCWADGDEGVAASAASASDSKRQRSE